MKLFAIPLLPLVMLAAWMPLSHAAGLTVVDLYLAFLIRRLVPPYEFLAIPFPKIEDRQPVNQDLAA